jgi:exonuclease V
MLSSLEALLTLGKCRELPVVGFIKEYMVVGVIVSLAYLDPR